jgi:hypothetical protein
MLVVTRGGTYYVPGSLIIAACGVVVAGWLALAWRRWRRKARIRRKGDYLRAQLGLGDENRARLEADLPVDVADDVAVLAELHVRVIDQPGAAGRTLDGHRCGDATTQVTKSIVTMRAGRFRDQ